jgi:hypothetical protein
VEKHVGAGGDTGEAFVSITIEDMVIAQTLSTTHIVAPASEAPQQRAVALGALLNSLQLRRERLTPSELELVASEVAGHQELWRDLVVDSPEKRWWLVLWRSANYEVRLLSWEVAQSSDWHDHGGSSGGFAVVDGTLDERYRTNAGADVRGRRFGTGSSGCFGPAHVHDMVHVAGTPAASVHAYSPPLTFLTTYEETPYGLVVSGLQWDADRR